MRLELKEFAKAARSMHQQPGGLKRTRLMLHLRPFKTRKIFVLKATDGRTTLTTRVEHQGQIKLVEALVGDFVTECTRLSVPPPPSTAGTTSAAAAAPATADAGAADNQPSSPSATTNSAAAAGASPKERSAAAGKAAAGGGNAGNQAASAAQQKGGKPANKGKKGKKH